jgi:hypothetical protein
MSSNAPTLRWTSPLSESAELVVPLDESLLTLRVVYISYITSTGNLAKFHQLSSGQLLQRNRYGTEKEDVTTRPSRTKSHLPGQRRAAVLGRPTCFRPCWFGWHCAMDAAIHNVTGFTFQHWKESIWSYFHSFFVSYTHFVQCLICGALSYFFIRLTYKSILNPYT